MEKQTLTKSDVGTLSLGKDGGLEIGKVEAYPSISTLCRKAGLLLSSPGRTVGIGNEVIGLVDPEVNQFVPFKILDTATLDEVSVLSIDPPESAYPKAPLLACIVQEGVADRDLAMKHLEMWCGEILMKGFQMKEFVEKGTAASMHLPDGELKRKALVDA